MTSHIRHRRGLPFPDLIEPGEVVPDPVNRQLTVGDIDGAAGVKVPLLAIRYFDARASYVVDEYVVHGDSIWRSLGAVAPGPFNPVQWAAVVGSGGGGTELSHTPLYGYNDGASHTLILQHSSDGAGSANTIDFRNLSGDVTAKLWTDGTVGGGLHIQSSSYMDFIPEFVGFDDSYTAMQVTAHNVTLTSMDVQGGLVLQNTVNDVSKDSVIDFRNAASVSVGNLWVSGNPAVGFWMQSAGTINFAPGHPGIDGVGTALQVGSSNVHVYNALVVDGAGDISGNIRSNGSLTLGNNAEITSQNGWLVVQAPQSLYLRSPTAVLINDSTAAPTHVGGSLTVSGAFTGVQGGSFQNDLTVSRSYAPSQGTIYLGSEGKGLRFDGTDLNADSMRGIVINEPVAGNHAATRNYVDGKASAVSGQLGNYLPLTGGDLSGELFVHADADLWGGPSYQGCNTIGVRADSPQVSAGISFYIGGLFASNFGLRADGNFYMGGWSHGDNVTYKFWTTRELTQNPFSDIRLAYAGDEGMGTHASEPFPGAVVTGISSGIVSPPTEPPVSVRYRYLQVKIGSSWFTVALA